MEIHKKIENDIPVLDPDGKICGFTSNKLYQTSLFPKSEFKCTECNNRFATQKSLTNHMKVNTFLFVFDFLKIILIIVLRFLIIRADISLLLSCNSSVLPKERR